MIEEVNAKLKQAMLARDQATVAPLKMLKSALDLRAKEVQDFSHEIQLEVLRKQLKQRQDAAESYKQAGADDKAEQELAEAKVLEQFMPKQLSPEELGKLVDDVIKESGVKLEKRNFGQLIGLISTKAGAQASKADIALCLNRKM